MVLNERERVIVVDGEPYQPTGIEANVYAALDAAGITYQAQKQYGWYRVDAWLTRYNVALEIQGCWWHACSECWGDEPTPTGVPAADVQARDERRRRNLLARHGVRVIELWGHSLLAEADALLAIHNALATLAPKTGGVATK